MKRVWSANGGLAICSVLAVFVIALGGSPAAHASTKSESTGDPAVEFIVRTSPTDEELRKASSGAQLVRLLVRCVDLDGETYCLHIGFTEADTSAPDFWTALSEAAANESTGPGTGAASLSVVLQELAAHKRVDRVAAEVEQVRAARAAVGKVKLLRYRSLNRPVPPSLFNAYPELRSINSRAVSRHTRWKRAVTAVEPVTYKVMSDSDAKRQVKSYYCGPASIQMIDHGDDGTFETQDTWANRLGTTTGGTAITNMVQQINERTAWDAAAGNYTVVSVANWDNDRYWNAITNQVGYYGAPYLAHPLLHSDYFGYLSTSGGYSGHFQPGRGYQVQSDGDRFVHILEPYNEPDWTGWTTTTWGPRTVRLYKALNAEKANSSFQNIGI